MKKTRIVAECSVLSALSIIILLLGAVFEPLDLSCAFIAGLAVLTVRLRWGRKSALLLYSCTAVLSFLLLHNKLPVFLYIFYGGLFPIVKAEADLLTNAVIRWVLKIAFGCLAYTALIFVSLNIFGIKGMDFTYSIPAYLAVIGVTFCVDVAVSMLIGQFGRVILRKRK